MSVILALGRQRQEDQEFQASLSYLAGPCIKKQTNKIQCPILKYFVFQKYFIRASGCGVFMETENHCYHLT
jgi:hypothetical protein